MVMRRSDHVLIELKSQHEENGYRWDSTQGLGEQVRITRKNGWKGSSGTSLLRIYYLIDLHDASCKTCPFMPMQSRNNDKIYSNSECKCSIYNHDNDALLRCMIAMMVQHEDGVFHARVKWCIWHDAIAMMLAQWCIHQDARMTMLATYARKRCIKYDAHIYDS